ncbi:MAG: DUF393 domain-containing protein [Fibrobacteria bacterium]|nr:DUF393 domain-containing protein [Fibrobacteria bacterium]
MSGNPIILFDGVCNLCEASIQFVIKKDTCFLPSEDLKNRFLK